MNELISYEYLYSLGNLTLAWRKARDGKTAHQDIMEFEENLERNLFSLHNELKSRTYEPRQLKTFVLRDPKTRKISKADFRDRVVHHALINVIGPKFQKSFIYDSCANQIGKGTSLALKRFDVFRRKVTRNNKRIAFCLKADIRHYFDEIDHEILLSIITEKIKDEGIIWLVKQILESGCSGGGRATFGALRRAAFVQAWSSERRSAGQLHIAIFRKCISKQI